MLEKELEAWCVKESKKKNCLLLKLSPQYTPGLPDRLLIGPYGDRLIEFKASGKKLTPIQVRMHAKIKAAGGQAYVCDSKEGFLEMLEDVSGDGGNVPV